jgi:hypothetical protein
VNYESVAADQVATTASEANANAFPMLMGYRFGYATLLQPASPIIGADMGSRWAVALMYVSRLGVPVWCRRGRRDGGLES